MPERNDAQRQELTAAWDRREHLLDAFEAAWRRGEQPAIEDYLPSAEARSELLTDFVHADLEHRLRAGAPARVEDYLERFPDLAHNRAGVAGLIAWEYELRRRQEPNLAPQAFLDRFPQFRKELLQQLHTLPGEDAETGTPGNDSVVGEGEGRESIPSSAPTAAVGSLGFGGGWFIGKYRVVEKLGSGGQAEVYRAVHPTLGRDVAIKLARENLSEAARRLLISEGQVLARLEDPGVVRVYDVDLYEGRPFVAFEYVRGRSLAERLKQERLSFRESAALVAELASTLSRLHQRGVLHRDLKPANVLIDDAGRPRLLDFGLASLAQHGAAINCPGPEISGTPAYMAPEQAHGEANRIGPRTDIFNLGALFYELLTGRPPYQADDAVAAWEQACAVQVTPPRQLNRRIPRALERICLKALAADVEQRYASARRMAQSLRGYLRRPLRIALTLGLFMLTGAVVLGLALGPFGKTSRVATATNEVPGESAPVEIRSFTLWASRDKLGDLGEVGVTARDICVNDSVQIRAQFSKPAFCYLIAFNPDGKEQLCFPSTPDDRSAPDELPAPVKELRFPRSPTRDFQLEDGTGMQAFVLLVSAKPLPAYARWQQEVGVAPWQKASVSAIWRFDGKDFECVNKRGKVREREAIPEPLVALCHFFRDCPRIEALHVIAFPVNP
jgi:predicted Ser/Thr protein kinase